MIVAVVSLNFVVTYISVIVRRQWRPFDLILLTSLFHFFFFFLQPLPLNNDQSASHTIRISNHIVKIDTCKHEQKKHYKTFIKKWKYKSQLSLSFLNFIAVAWLRFLRVYMMEAQNFTIIILIYYYIYFTAAENVPRQTNKIVGRLSPLWWQQGWEMQCRTWNIKLTIDG